MLQASSIRLFLKATALVVVSALVAPALAQDEESLSAELQPLAAKSLLLDIVRTDRRGQEAKGEEGESEGLHGVDDGEVIREGKDGETKREGE